MLVKNLPAGVSAEGVLRNFCLLRYEPKVKIVRYYSELKEDVMSSKPGDIIFVAGDKFYGQSVGKWEVGNRSQLASLMRARPDLLGIDQTPGVQVEILDRLVQIPYFLEDFRSGALRQYNKVTICLVTHEDFLG